MDSARDFLDNQDAVSAFGSIQAIFGALTSAEEQAFESDLFSEISYGSTI